MGSSIYKWLLGTLIVVGIGAAVVSSNTTTPSAANVQTAAVENYQQQTPPAPPTQTTPVPQIFTTTLSYGSSGTAVDNLQQFLSDEGLYSGRDTGIFDQATFDAVFAFQQQEGIAPANGVFGSSEQAAANQIMAAHPDWVTYLSNSNSYTNVNGSTVQSPANSSNGVPAGASALCRDGTYSFSMHRSGTCSHHGGVSQWLQ